MRSSYISCWARCWVSDFYQSKQWRQLREWALSRYGAVCMRCRSTNSIEVDHIKSRSRHHRLKLRKSNVQILCKPCNQSKGSIDSTDYRPIYWKVYYGVVMILKLLPWAIILWIGVIDYQRGPWDTTIMYQVLSVTWDYLGIAGHWLIDNFPADELASLFSSSD